MARLEGAGLAVLTGEGELDVGIAARRAEVAARGLGVVLVVPWVAREAVGHSLLVAVCAIITCNAPNTPLFVLCESHITEIASRSRSLVEILPRAACHTRRGAIGGGVCARAAGLAAGSSVIVIEEPRGAGHALRLARSILVGSWVTTDALEGVRDRRVGPCNAVLADARARSFLEGARGTGGAYSGPVAL